MKNTVLPAAALIESKNPEWGFRGTIQRNHDLTDVEANSAFDVACRSTMNAFKVDEAVARRFMDSRYARHIADRFRMNNLPQIEARMVEVFSLTLWRKSIALEIKAAKKSTDADWYNN